MHNLLDLLAGVFELLASLAGTRRARPQPVPDDIRHRIIADGGSPGEGSSAGLLLIHRQLFPSVAGRRTYYKLAATYAHDHGTWLVCAPAQGEPLWTWHSAIGRTSRPGDLITPTRVIQAIPGNPWWYIVFMTLAVVIIVVVPVAVVLKMVGVFS